MTDGQLIVLKAVTDVAITELAELHGTTESMVKIALKAGQQVVCEQFKRLMAVGIAEVNKMATEASA